MNVLLTGGAGYIGSVLTRLLIDRGHQVRIVDCGFFGLDHVDLRAELIAGNILDFDREWLDGIEAVIHLAGLSNDPMAAFSPSLNYMVNAGGAAITAQAAKDAGIGRFVFGSTCSVYGLDDGEPLNEEHPTHPPFPYAISKLMAERQLGCLTDDRFRPITLRKGTVVGWSPRMRFDLVINAMIKSALVDGNIVVHNPRLWRPLIDVEDAAEAYVRALEADLGVTGVFNISSRNFTLAELGLVVADGLRKDGIDVTIHTENRTDVRSYRVSTTKAANVLKFTAKKPMSQTVTEVIKKAMAQPIAELEDPRYYNIRQMERLMSEGLLNGHGRGNGHVAKPKQTVIASGTG
jgi:nucleoside-diphosphate-sugar epimerase